MKVIPEGLSSGETVIKNSSENSTCYEKKVTNENKLDGKIDKSNIMKKGEVCKNCVTEADGSCSEDDSNVNSEKTCKSTSEQNGKKVSYSGESVDELTTQIMKIKVSDTTNKNESIDRVSEKLSVLTVKDRELQDGRKSPQLLPRGPNGGRAVAFNQMMYGQPDWSATQANVRMKAMSGKRGYDEEINPFKYTKNCEPVEHGDYTDVSFMTQKLPHQSMPQVMPHQSMSQVMPHQSMPQVMPHQSMPSVMPSQSMPYSMASQSIPRPLARAYRHNLNNLNQPQTANYQGMNKDVLSGGSVTVGPADSILQQLPINSDPSAPDWDPDGLLALLEDSPFNLNDGFDTNQFPQEVGNYTQSAQPQYKIDEQIINYQMKGLQKTKRNLSGDDGYDTGSEVSRMSMSTTGSPYSPPDSVMSVESMPSPQSVGQTKASPYVHQNPFSPDSAINSPASYRDQGSPASHRSAMSPAMSPPSLISVESPMPSPGNMPLSGTDGHTQDIIISELNKPIPHSPVDHGMSTEQYINENLSCLAAVYEVIAEDLKEQQTKKTEKQSKNINCSEAKTVTTTATPVTVPPKVSMPEPAVAVTAPVQAMPVPTSTMTPVILKPLNSTAVQANTLQQPQLIQVGQGTKMPMIGQQIAGQPISGQNIVWVPLNPAPPIIVVRQTTPAGAKKGGPTKPRPILPKMPTVLPGSSKTSTSVTATSNSKPNITSIPSAKTQVVNSAPTVVNALNSSPAGRSANKIVSSQNTMSVNNTSTMLAGQFQQQQQKQLQQPMARSVQGQLAPNMGVSHPLNPAMDGCAPNKLNLARRYIAEMKKEDLHFQDQDGDTYLHVAICRTDPYLVKAILERLVREGLIKDLIDKPNRKRQTPLYVAVADNQPLMVRELVHCGADPNCLAECQWNNGMRKEVKAAIHCAAQGGHLFTATLAELLKAKDIALNLANSEGLTAVHCAIQEHGKVRGGHVINSIPTVDMLIRAGADPNVQDKKSGKTPLMYAIETKDYSLVLSMVNLIDKDKLRNMLKTQTFDGSNCSKICSGLRMDSDVDGWRKINSLILSVSNGSDPRLSDNVTMMIS